MALSPDPFPIMDSDPPGGEAEVVGSGVSPLPPPKEASKEL